MSCRLELLAPAKINLHLRVGRPRADGFHPLVSWMCTVGIFDKLTLESSSTAGVSMTCDRPDLRCDDSNLVYRAAVSASRFRPDGIPPGLVVSLRKRVPIGAGLGGGSSDAARTLLGLEVLWKLGLPPQRLAAMAGELGSDVPFFLYEPSALCSGRGEIVRPQPPPAPRWALLILPKLRLATLAVYREFDRLHLGKALATDREPPIDDWRRLSASELLEHLQNDLEPAAFALAGDLRRLRDSAESALSRAVRMSGSGSALFSLYDDGASAQRDAQVLAARMDAQCVAAELCPRIADDLQQTARRGVTEWSGENV